MRNNQISIPQAVEAEKAILSTILYEPKRFFEVRELLKPEHFFDSDNQKIYSAMIELDSEDKEIEQINLYEKVKGTLPITAITDLRGICNIDDSKKLIYQKFMLRSLSQFGQKLISISDQDDPFEVVEQSESALFNITQGAYSKSFQHIKKVNDRTLALIEAIKKKGENSYVTPTGYYDLDNIIGGLKKTDFIIIAARPSMGKTSLALNIAENIAKDKPVGIFSLEMGDVQLSARLIAGHCGVDVSQLLTGKFKEQELLDIARATQKINTLKIYIDDSPALDIYELKSKAKRMKMEQGIEVLFVDYLQLIKNHTEKSREREIASIADNLKELAKTLDIPVVALSQLNRALEARTTKKPQLSDLRESGNIEQAADMVMFIHRPEVYGITATEDGTPTLNLAEVIVDKNRNGATGTAKLTFIKNKTRFENYSRF